MINIQASLIKNQRKDLKNQSDSLIKVLFENNDRRIRENIGEYLTENQKKFITTIISNEVKRYWDNLPTQSLNSPSGTKSISSYDDDIFKKVYNQKYNISNNNIPTSILLTPLEYEKMKLEQKNLSKLNLGSISFEDSSDNQFDSPFKTDNKTIQELIKQLNQINPLYFPLDTTIKLNQ